MTMAVIQTGNDLGNAVLKALGIDSKMVAEVSISMKPNETASITIVRLVDQHEADGLAKVLEQYTLEAKPEDPETKAMETVARNLVKG
jgi:hypothetical protein